VFANRNYCATATAYVQKFSIRDVEPPEEQSDRFFTAK
jgi:hypothetical protein